MRSMRQLGLERKDRLSGLAPKHPGTSIIMGSIHEGIGSHNGPFMPNIKPAALSLLLPPSLLVIK